MSDITSLRLDLDHIDSRLSDLAEVEAGLLDSLKHIGIDMDNTLAEFIGTTGRDPSEYHPWRRKAKLARYHKDKALSRVRSERMELMAARTRVQMLLLASESGYRGEDSLGLLKATFLLLMSVLDQTKFVIEPEDAGLISAVQLHCGYGVPGDTAERRSS